MNGKEIGELAIDGEGGREQLQAALAETKKFVEKNKDNLSKGDLKLTGQRIEILETALKTGEEYVEEEVKQTTRVNAEYQETATNFLDSFKGLSEEDKAKYSKNKLFMSLVGKKLTEGTDEQDEQLTEKYLASTYKDTQDSTELGKMQSSLNLKKGDKSDEEEKVDTSKLSDSERQDILVTDLQKIREILEKGDSSKESVSNARVATHNSAGVGQRT